MDVMELVENKPNVRPFQCDWQTCSKSFDRNSDFRRHYRIHTNERPYSCLNPVCGKSFVQQSALTVHTRTHTGQKPFQCQHSGCDKRFSDSSGFRRHCRIHTSKGRYKCTHEGCLKSFCHKTAMVKHQRQSHQNLTRLEFDNEISESNSDEYQDTFLFQNSLSYVPDQNNPHVTTLNTDLPSTPSLHQQLSQEVLLSSLSSYSSASPVSQEAVYTLPPVQVATRAIQYQRPLLIEQQPTVYQQQMPLSLGQQHLHSTSQAPVQPFDLQDWSKGFGYPVWATGCIYSFSDQWPQKIESFGPSL